SWACANTNGSATFSGASMPQSAAACADSGDNSTMNRRDFAALLGAGLALPQAWGQEESLKALGAAKGLRVGNAIGMKTFRDPQYRALMARECSTLVTENECKWQAVSPREGARHYGPADEIFAWGREAGMMLRGHCLVWQPTKWLPAWVNDYD